MDTYSVLSQAAYTYYKNDENVEETEKEIESYGLENYKIDKELSDPESLVLFNNQGNEITLAIRGTQLPNLQDILADVQIAVGYQGFTQRFTNEEAKLQDIMGKYPDKKHVVTGHSLGGNIAYKLGRKYNIEGHHFNTGASISEASYNLEHLITCGLQSSKQCDALMKQTFYTTNRDPISIAMLHPLVDKFGRQNVKYSYRPGTDFLAHSIEHFLPDKVSPAHKIKDSTFVKSNKVSPVHKTKYSTFVKSNPQFTIRIVRNNQAIIARNYCRDNPNDKRCKIY